MPAHHRAGAGNRHAHPFRQVDPAADDRLRFSVSDIHPAYPQLVRVGLGLDLLDDTDDHLVKAARQILHVLHLHGGHGQVISQLFQVHILRELHIIPDPR